MPAKGFGKREGEMTEFILVYITAKNLEEARSIASKLVEEKLVACANVIPKIESVFRWKGRIEKQDEAAIIAKTKKDLSERLVKRVKELHSYETPCIITLPIEGGNPDFLKWLGEV